MSKQSSKSDMKRHTEEEKAIAEILVDNFAAAKEPSGINDAATPKDYTPVVAGAGSITATVASDARSKKNKVSTPYDAPQDEYVGDDDDELIDTRKTVNLAPKGGYTPLANTSQRRQQSNKRPSKLFTTPFGDGEEGANVSFYTVSYAHTNVISYTHLHLICLGTTV
jgi:hypothetical protein